MFIHKIAALLAGIVFFIPILSAESSGGGTIEGTVFDPSGAVMAGADVTIRNPITNYKQSTTTDGQGAFRFTNVPSNPYHLSVSASGFNTSEQDVAVRSAVPVTLKISLALASAATTVKVEAAGETLVENEPSAHTDMDRQLFSKMPSISAGSGLSDIITMSVGNVAADSNGFFHPQGDHAQTSFSIDGQPVSDQQSKLFSTQLPPNAVQSMELITGAPNAEYGDKTSLVVNATTRSGLGSGKPFGSFVPYWQSFGGYGEDGDIGFGTPKLGNFLAFNFVRSGRFLDSPEFLPIHDIGTNGTLFDRIDWQPNGKDFFHLNLFGARNWFQIPNTYDQPNQDQRQRVLSFNIAPGYQHVFNARTLITVDTFVRRDQVDYYPSRDPFNDQPATLAQQRFLTNYGVKADVSYVRGGHNIKFGTQIMQTRLKEDFSLGLTDPAFNAVCVDGAGNPLALSGVMNPAGCTAAGAGFSANPAFLPGLLPFDLTRGGSLFQFNGNHNVNEYAVYVQDAITLGKLNISPSLRVDNYYGLLSDHALEPRIGVSYLFSPTKTVLRASYARMFETPYNENLILSSATGAGGLATNIFGATAEQPIKPGRRNQYEVGFQQGLGRFFQIDASYFWKYTANAYDFDTLFSTPITFPISWRKSKIDGVGVRISSVNIHGFQFFNTFGHTRARFFGPEVGGVIFNSPLDTAAFRIDHDQAFQQTTMLRYQRPKNGPWVNFTWRYDSGEVAGSVTDTADTLALTGAQQAAIGFECGSQIATRLNPVMSCAGQGTATRLVIPKDGTENNDTNPPRIAPRNLFDIGVGTDNLLHGDHKRIILRFTVVNLTNQASLYNFLSTFSGTHWVAPRTYEAALGFAF